MRRRCAQFAASFSLALVIGCGSDIADEKAGTIASPVAQKSVAADRVDDADAGGADAMNAVEFAAEPRTKTRRDSDGTRIETGEDLETDSAQPSPKAGTLTAGSLDDQKNFADFVEYVRTALQSGVKLPEFASQLQHQRAVIRVEDARGKPIGGAEVAVFANDQQRPKNANIDSPESLVTLKTGTNGQTIFLPQMDASMPSDVVHYLVEVHVDDHVQRQEVNLDGNKWVVTIEDAQSTLPQQLDLALIIDTTGSMQDELNYLKAEIDHIAQRINVLYPNVDQRFAVVLYRDNGDAYVTRTHDFTGSLAEFRSVLAQQSARGGGDFPEAMDAALQQATQLSWRSGDTARVAFVVGDAPPHARDYQPTFKAINQLRLQDVTLFPVAASGVDDKAEFILRAASFLTQGKYLFLTDHSGVGNAHATPDAPKFNVEKLNQLMIRMIASELAGRDILASEIIATESKGNPQDEAIPSEQRQRQVSAVQPPEVMHCTPPMASKAESTASSLSIESKIRLTLIGICAAVLGCIHLRSHSYKPEPASHVDV